MAKIKETIHKKLTEYLWAALAGMLGVLLVVVWQELSLPFFQKVLPELSKTGLGSIILTQFLVLVCAFAYLIVTRNKKRKYRFDKHLGIYFHKRTGDPFCTSCMANDIESPLRESKDHWCCEFKSCEKHYSNPDYKSPPTPNRIRK